MTTGFCAVYLFGVGVLVDHWWQYTKFMEYIGKKIHSRLQHGCVLMALLLVSLVFWGCQSGKKNAQSGAAAASDTARIASKRDLSGVKVGYCSPSLNAPFYVALEQAVQKNATAYQMQYVSVDGQGDITKQITGIEDLISKGVQVLIVNPLDPKALVPTVNMAAQSGIPVFIVDSYIEPDAQYVASVLADNQGNGELLGQWMAGEMGGQQIKLALVSGAAGNPVGREKRLGFVRGVVDHQLKTNGSANLQIAAQGWGGWTIAGGLKAMEDILVAHPDINLVVAENDAMALGARKAIAAAAKSSAVKVIGFDGQKDALKLIKEGQLAATALNSPSELGKLVIEAVVRQMNGDQNRGLVIHTKAAIINSNNVDQFYDPDALF